MYISFDDGAHWQSLQLKLPIVPVTDLLVHDDALIAATQGRGFWMLDDIEPLRQLTPEVAAKSAYLFTPPLDVADGGRRTARRRWARRIDGGDESAERRDRRLLRSTQKPKTKVSLAFLGADGKVIREFKGEVQAEPAKPREVTGGTGARAAAEAAKPALRRSRRKGSSPRAQLPSSSRPSEAEGGRRRRPSGRPERQAHRHRQRPQSLRVGPPRSPTRRSSPA